MKLIQRKASGCDFHRSHRQHFGQVLRKEIQSQPAEVKLIESDVIAR